MRKNDVKEIISGIKSLPTIIEKYKRAKEILYSKTENDLLIKEVEGFLEELRDYQVNLLNAIKEGKDYAFDELLNVKDIKNFIHHYAWHIRKFYRFQYREFDIVNEIKYQIYYTIKKNYKIYNQPNEFSLLINSMRKWIKQKVGSGLKDTYKPKKDELLPILFLEDDSYDYSEKFVREVIEQLLTPEDQIVFKLRFFEGMGYKQIGLRLGRSKDTIQRRYEKTLKQIKGYMEDIGKWQ